MHTELEKVKQKTGIEGREKKHRIVMSRGLEVPDEVGCKCKHDKTITYGQNNTR